MLTKSLKKENVTSGACARTKAPFQKKGKSFSVTDKIKEIIMRNTVEGILKIRENLSSEEWEALFNTFKNNPQIQTQIQAIDLNDNIFTFEEIENLITSMMALPLLSPP